MDELKTPEEQYAANRTHRVPARPGATRRRVLWIVVILLLLAALVWWIHHGPAQRARTGRFDVSGAMPVVAASAKSGNIDIVDDALGTVTPLATVTVQTQINGQLLSVGFQEGQEVKKGDFLAQIDPRPYQAALDQAQGQLAKDQASLGMARMDYLRYQKLAAQNSIAKQQAQDQEYVVGQDEGTVKLDQAQVETAKLNLAYCRIVAPVSGRIGLRLIDPGNYVQISNTTGIAVIAQMQPITVVFTLPEDNLPAVMDEMQKGTKLQVTAYDRSNTVKLETGTLAAVDSTIDTTTGTVKLRAQFDNADEKLFPNQFVNAHLLVKVLQGVTVIPSAAVQRGSPGTFVYLIKPDNTVSVQKITLGPESGGQVVSGLSSGQQVVVDGADKLREGAKISLRQESTAPPGTTSGASSSGAAAPPASAPPGQPQNTPPAATPPANAPNATTSPPAAGTTTQPRGQHRGSNP